MLFGHFALSKKTTPCRYLCQFNKARPFRHVRRLGQTRPLGRSGQLGYSTVGEEYLTIPLGAPSFAWGDIVEYCDFYGKFNLGLITLVSENSLHRCQLRVFNPDRGFIQLESFFLRFWSPKVLERPSDQSPIDTISASRCIGAFESTARNVLHKNFPNFEKVVDERAKCLSRTDGLSSLMLLYEAELAEAVFGVRPRPEELYAVHLYMFSYSKKFGRDPSYSIALPPYGSNIKGFAASGPYFLRSTHQDYPPLEEAILLIQQSPELVAQFRNDLVQTQKTRKIGAFVNNTKYHPFLNLIMRASITNWQDSHHNPLVEAVQVLLRGVAPGSQATDLASLLKQLELNKKLENVDIPLIQSGLDINRATSLGTSLHGTTSTQGSSTQMATIQMGSFQTGDSAHMSHVKGDSSKPPPAPKAVSSTKSSPTSRLIWNGKAHEGKPFDLPALAIDSEGTVEVDDAVSIEKTQGETWLHVHVADPAALIHADSPEDTHAMHQSITLYFAHDVFPMLPYEVGAKASLDPGRTINSVLTFSAKLDSRGDILDYKVELKNLTRLQRLSYEASEELLETTGKPSGSSLALQGIESLTTKHEAFRNNRGSVAFDVPSLRPYFSRNSDGSLSSLRLKDDTNVHRMKKLVAECMIIAGRVAALHAIEQRIPVPFRYHLDPAIRGGEEFREIYRKVQQAGPAATLYDKFRLMSYFQASAIDIVPRPHWSMGLDSYCKATSPLRRYFDLFLHQQIRDSLTGKTARDTSQLKDIVPEVYRQERYRKRLMDRSSRYWTFRYIERALRAQQDERGAWAPLQVNVIPLEYYPSNGKMQLFIQDFALRTFDTVPGGLTLSLGETYKLDIVAVDPPRQSLALRLAQ